MSRRREIMDMTSTDPAGLADLMLAWEDELSKVMPRDSKDWWQGDRCAWCGEPGEMSDMEGDA